MVGITSYGTYIPRYRIRTEDIAAVWGKDGESVVSSLRIKQKSVPALDEDAVTIAVEASLSCFAANNSKPQDVDVLFIGSESHPYAVNPTSTIVGELLGVGNSYLAADFQFACKAATAALVSAAGLVESSRSTCALIVGSDAAQSKTHDALEYTSAAAGVAVQVGSRDVAAELVLSTSYSSDTPDFWRRDGIRYPSHAGRFTGEPAYFTHVTNAATMLLDQSNMKPKDFSHCVFHMPNGKFPVAVAKRLGFTRDQLVHSLIVEDIGNPYSASSLMGLAAVLDVAKPGDTIFMVSYGSGAGSDGFIWNVTDHIVGVQKDRKQRSMSVQDQVQQATYIQYVDYLKQTKKI